MVDDTLSNYQIDFKRCCGSRFQQTDFQFSLALGQDPIILIVCHRNFKPDPDM